MCQNFQNKARAFFLVSVVALCFLASSVEKVESSDVLLPLGIVFEQGSPEVQNAFKQALVTFITLNITTNPRDYYRFNAYVDTINTADAFKLSKLICNQFSRGIYAMLGHMNAESFHTYHAFANTFHMPLVTPWYPPKDQLNGDREQSTEATVADYATRLRPDFNPAILDVINHYGWKEIIYLYSNNDGLLRLQTLFYRHSEANKSIKVKLVKKITTADKALEVLREVEKAERFSNKYVLLDCPTAMAKEIIVAHVRDINLGRRTYHYLLTELAFDEEWESDVMEYTAVNITGFRIVDPERDFVQNFLSKWATSDFSGKNYISADGAFMFDAMLVIKEAFTEILTGNPFALKRYGQESACDSGSDFLDDIRPFEYGQTVNEHLRKVQASGLTGNIQFHENGTRKYFTVDVIELQENVTKVKIGHWSDFSGFRKNNKYYESRDSSKSSSSSQEKVYVVSTILEQPYLTMNATNGKLLREESNRFYDGYIKDLTDLLFTGLGLKYRFHLVRDNQYGSKVQTRLGESWNGMIGEVIRNEVDLAIGPLTITSERERVVEFTKPFLTQGIAMMAHKARKPVPGMFSFLNPFAETVWISTFGAYLAATVVLYLIYRLTPVYYPAMSECQFQMDIQEPHCNSNSQQICKQFHTQQSTFIVEQKLEKPYVPIANFLWVTFSILTTSRSSNFTSRSLAAKFAGMVWWLFALILVSMYTGNYIALRMKNRVSSPVTSAWDLVSRSGFTSIQYGILERGSTYEFFKNSENQIYRAMFDHITGSNALNAKTNDQGVELVRKKKGSYVFIMESAKIDYVSNMRPCNTFKVGQDLSDIHYGIALPVGSALTVKLNLELLKLRDDGVLKQLEDKWWGNQFECSVASKVDQIESPLPDELSLSSIAGIFYFLIVGLVIAVVVTIVEATCNSKKRPRALKSSMNFDSSLNHGRAANTMDSVPHDFCDIPPPTDLNSK